MVPEPQPFTLRVPDRDIEDLRSRLALTRFPDQAPGDAWAFGADLGAVRDLVAYWKDGFDWRAEEARLNAFPQFKVHLHGIDLHYLHVPGKGPDPCPLLLLHGWPGSVFEFLDLIPRLVDPANSGGDPADSFTVVAPSLPGYGPSFQPGQKRFGVPEMADCVAHLMHDVLGFERFAAQGGDWGASIVARLGAVHPEKLLGVHANFLAAVPRDPSSLPASTPEEKRFVEELKGWLKEETGYNWIQGTKPQTLAYGLTDSPAGLAAWILEKFQGWTDNDGDPWSAVDRDRVLANIAFYWFTGCANSSFWPYYARLHGALPVPEGRTVDVPVGYAAFPREILRPPRSVAERTYTDIRRWTEMGRGGHFAAMEQPDALAREVQEFFRPLRQGEARA